MPKIEINTCQQTPNYCALEAVAKAMKTNLMHKNHREYQYETLVEVESGRLLKVVETPMDINAELSLDCEFSVEKIEA